MRDNSRPYMFYAVFSVAAVALLLAPEQASAAALSDWLTGLKCYAKSLQDAMRIFALVAVIALGVAVMFMELRGWLNTLMTIMLGISLAVFGTSFLDSIWSAQGGSFSVAGALC